MAREPPTGELSAQTLPSRRAGARVYAGELDGAMCAACAAHAGLEYNAVSVHAPTILTGMPRARRYRCGWV